MECRKRGFTLIEIVMLVLVISIMSVVLATRINPVAPARLVSAGEKLIADINHARRSAMSEHRRYAVDFNGSSYRVRYVDIENGEEVLRDVPCPHTGEVGFGRDFSGRGISLSADFNGTSQLRFGSFGRPFDANDEELAGDGYVEVEYAGSIFMVKVVSETGSVIREQ